jgi:hypothetical protein
MYARLWAMKLFQRIFLVLCLLGYGFSIANAQQPVTPTQTPTVTGAIGWPPKLAVGQNWYISIEKLGDWSVTLDGKDADGDPIGKAKNLRNSSVLNVFFYYDKQKDFANLLLTDGKISQLCQFGSYGVTDFIMTGATFVKDSSTPFKPYSGFCTAALDDGTGRGKPDLKDQTVPEPSQKTNALWPPNLEVGQTWQVSIPTVGDWTLKLSGKDKDGDPFGKALAANSSLDAYFYWVADTRNAVLQMTDGVSIWGCVFPEGGLNGQTLSGEAVYQKDKNAQTVLLNQTCTAELIGGASIIKASSTTTTPPNSSGIKLSWPPNIEVGQAWKVQIGAQIYDINLSKLLANVPSGTAKNGNAKLDTFFFYSSKENRAILELSGAYSQIVCNFEITGIAGSSMTGAGSYRLDKNKPYTPLKDKCVATLISVKSANSSVALQNMLKSYGLNWAF